MSTNDYNSQNHPEELLAAYVLDALDEEEEIQVEAHLEDCSQCRLAVGELHGTASRLGESVAHLEAPGHSLGRVLNLLEPMVGEPVVGEPAVAPTRPVRSAPSSGWLSGKAVRIMVPIAASVVVALFSLTLVMNFRVADRTDSLEQQNSTLAEQVATSSAKGENLAETVQDLRATNYWLANQSERSLTLDPPSGAGNSRDILMVSADGRRAVLMVSDLRDASQSSTYHVWLMRGGERLWVGKVNVDDGGWGTTTLQPRDPVFGFDKVELVAERISGTASGPADMILEGEIPSSKPSQKLIFPQWR